MWLQRFKEMREMHGASSRDDRQKREQQRQEREMAKFAQMYQIFCSFPCPICIFFRFLLEGFFIFFLIILSFLAALPYYRVVCVNTY